MRCDNIGGVYKGDFVQKTTESYEFSNRLTADLHFAVLVKLTLVVIQSDFAAIVYQIAWKVRIYYLLTIDNV